MTTWEDIEKTDAEGVGKMITDNNYKEQKLKCCYTCEHGYEDDCYEYKCTKLKIGVTSWDSPIYKQISPIGICDLFEESV